MNKTSRSRCSLALAAALAWAVEAALLLPAAPHPPPLPQGRPAAPPRRADSPDPSPAFRAEESHGALPPGATEEWWRGVRNSLRDQRERAESLATSPAWTGEGDQDGAGFGYSVATAGDVNGDGFSDVVVGAHGHDGGGTDRGRAYVFHGSRSGPSASPSWTGTGDQDHCGYGCCVATAGDVNGDGYSDVIVGAYNHDAGGSDRGRAYVYLGSASGLALAPVWTGSGNETWARYGDSVATAGDVNGDGYSDIVVGAYGHNCGIPFEVQCGRAYVYLGSSSGPSAIPAWTASGAVSWARFGISVATAGDVNGDGYADLIVGAEHDDSGSWPYELRGRAYVYLGSSTGLSSGHSWTVLGNQEHAYLGCSVSTAGDVNGDGYSDVAVGAMGHDGGGSFRGQAYVYQGSSSGLLTSPAWTGSGEEDHELYANWVATAGDANGDGFAEIAVGAEAYGPEAPINKGRAYVYSGSASGPALSAAWVVTGRGGDSYGRSVATAGDVNGDGFSDLISGAWRYWVDTGGPDPVTYPGQAYVYVGSAGGLSGSSSWAVPGDEDSAHSGYAVGSAGDVNGDGFSDVVVTAPWHDAGGNPGADRGRAYVFFGSGSGLSALPGWEASGDTDSAYFGCSAGAAGDVNGDGYGDLVVGAYGHPSGGSYRGRAYVYLGSFSGLPSIPAWVASGDENWAYFGCSVAGAGDVNGDGYAEVAVGAYGHDAGQGVGANRGRAYVHLGTVRGVDPNPAWVISGDENGACLGSVVATAGDVNRDGYSDLAVGAYGHDGGGSSGADRGRAYVYPGTAAGLLTSPIWTVSGDQNDAWFGHSLGTAGDVNGDGYSDLAVGANRWSDPINPGSERGRAYVYLGYALGVLPGPVWTGTGDEDGARFGCAVGTAGDVNGDGFSDLLVGAETHQAGGSDRGRAYAHLGSPTGPSSSPSWTVSGDEDLGYLGFSVGAAGDVNGDGYSDVVVGAPWQDAGGTAGADRGRAVLYLGNGGGGCVILPRQVRGDQSAPVALLGAAYGEACMLGLRMRSPFGRGAVRLEWQAVPLGESLDPSVNPPQTTPWWYDSGAESATVLELVDLSSDTGPWIWRARALYALCTTPFQSHGPWFTPCGNGLRETDLRSTADDPPPPCDPPDQTCVISSMEKTGGACALTWADPNLPSQRTGHNIRRSEDPSGFKGAWPLAGANATDEDPGAPGYQWTDSGSGPSPGSVWYYQITTYNALCAAEGPF